MPPPSVGNPAMTDSGFEPRNPEFERIIQESFAAQGLMRTFGAAITGLRPGFVEIGYDARPELSQQHGYMHAGLASAIVDSACGYAALSLASPGAEVLTAEFKVNFLAPARQERFLARGRVLKAGRLLMVCEGDVVGIEKGEEVPVARMQATMVIIAKG